MGAYVNCHWASIADVQVVELEGAHFYAADGLSRWGLFHGASEPTPLELARIQPHLFSGLIDRRVQKGEIWRYWTSQPGQASNRRAQLDFAVPITARAIRLDTPRFGDEANASVQVRSARIRLFSDAAGTVEVAPGIAGPLSVQGTVMNFTDIKAHVVRVEIVGVTGIFYGAEVANFAEIEVIARGEAAT